MAYVALRRPEFDLFVYSGGGVCGGRRVAHSCRLILKKVSASQKVVIGLPFDCLFDLLFLKTKFGKNPLK